SIFNQVRLLPEHIDVLARAVEIGEHEHDAFAGMEMVNVEQVLAAVGQPADRASALASLQSLEAAGCVATSKMPFGPHLCSDRPTWAWWSRPRSWRPSCRLFSRLVGESGLGPCAVDYAAKQGHDRLGAVRRGRYHRRHREGTRWPGSWFVMSWLREAP